MNTGHKPVLLGEVIGLMGVRAGARFLDCTFGGGGHTRALLEAAPGVQVTGMDRDPAARARAEGLAEEFKGRLTLIDRDFGRLDTVAETGFDGILFDLGGRRLGFNPDLFEPGKGLTDIDTQFFRQIAHAYLAHTYCTSPRKFLCRSIFLTSCATKPLALTATALRGALPSKAPKSSFVKIR